MGGCVGSGSGSPGVCEGQEGRSSKGTVGCALDHWSGGGDADIWSDRGWNSMVCNPSCELGLWWYGSQMGEWCVSHGRCDRLLGGLHWERVGLGWGFEVWMGVWDCGCAEVWEGGCGLGVVRLGGLGWRGCECKGVCGSVCGCG